MIRNHNRVVYSMNYWMLEMIEDRKFGIYCEDTYLPVHEDCFVNGSGFGVRGQGRSFTWFAINPSLN